MAPSTRHTKIICNKWKIEWDSDWVLMASKPWFQCTTAQMYVATFSGTHWPWHVEQVCGFPAYIPSTCTGVHFKEFLGRPMSSCISLPLPDSSFWQLGHVWLARGLVRLPEWPSTNEGKLLMNEYLPFRPFSGGMFHRAFHMIPPGIELQLPTAVSLSITHPLLAFFLTHLTSRSFAVWPVIPSWINCLTPNS